MDNSVYLLSSNMDLIRSFLNCDYMNDVFKLEGLSTNIYNFDCKSINKNKNVIIVIDNIGTSIEHLSIIKQLQKLQHDHTIQLLYACEHIALNIQMEINKLNNAKVMNKPLNFLAFLNWIQKQDKEEIANKQLENAVWKHLKYAGIPVSVLGFSYLKEAVILKSKQSKMKLIEICDRIARENHTTSSRVERCMRTALRNAESDCFAYLGINVSNVSCKEFIVYLANFISNEIKE